jgi:hypothetical protein
MTATLQGWLNIAATHITQTHNWAKTVEKAHFGHYYTIVSDNIDHYVIEKAAKPTFSFIGEQFRKHPIVYSVGLVLLIAFFAHPSRKEGDGTTPPPGTGPGTPATPSRLGRRNSTGTV